MVVGAVVVIFGYDDVTESGFEVVAMPEVVSGSPFLHDTVNKQRIITGIKSEIIRSDKRDLLSVICNTSNARIVGVCK